MKYDEEKEGYLLESGKKIEIDILYPYPNGTLYNPNYFSCDSYIDENLTPEERQEIAEYMIELWKEWAK